jgi:oxygen-independent coproporphyrinogen-3 oxidase
MTKPLLGIYLHYPFCAKKCPYCDYNTHVRASVDDAAWRAAYLAEIRHYAALIPDYTVASIFFGGGTPSLVPPETIAALIEAIHEAWPVTDDLEITLEANPTSSEAGRFQGYKNAGVNRVSLGVQALDDAALGFLGRTHSAAEGLRAMELAAQHFDRWSFDLMYGRPGHTVEAWEKELESALSCGAQHVALYQLTIEDNTAFARAHARGDFVLPDDETCLALFDATESIAAGHGLHHYEVSSFAVKGQECRHNLGYWQHRDYLGIGAGAHGRITLYGQRHAVDTIKQPEAWLSAVLRQGHGRASLTPLSRQEQVEEAVLLGLRLESGLDAAQWRQRFGTENSENVSKSGLLEAIARGLLIQDARGIRTTPQGLRVLNTVERLLLAA